MDEVALFVLGLAVGSFLNVLIYRIPHNLSPLGRSFCPNCHKQIKWHDNIPLVSFLFLGGKCRFCRSPISWQYPVVELVTGILFVIVAIHTGATLLSILSSMVTIYYLFVACVLIVIFFTDLRYGIIPDRITYPAIIVSTVYSLQSTDKFLSALGAAGFLLLLNRITRGRGMGLGDVKLAVLIGLFLGFPNIVVALYIAFLTGAFVSLILIFSGRKRFGQTLPFGPFLVFAALLALFIGEQIVQRFYSG